MTLPQPSRLLSARGGVGEYFLVHEEPGAFSPLDESVVFQRFVGERDRRNAYLDLGRQLTNGRQRVVQGTLAAHDADRDLPANLHLEALRGLAVDRDHVLIHRGEPMAANALQLQSRPFAERLAVPSRRGPPRRRDHGDPVRPAWRTGRSRCVPHVVGGPVEDRRRPGASSRTSLVWTGLVFLLLRYTRRWGVDHLGAVCM